MCCLNRDLILLSQPLFGVKERFVDDVNARSTYLLSFDSINLIQATRLIANKSNYILIKSRSVVLLLTKLLHSSDWIIILTYGLI